jgi:hypothetical protein
MVPISIDASEKESVKACGMVSFVVALCFYLGISNLFISIAVFLSFWSVLSLLDGIYNRLKSFCKREKQV